MTQLHILIILLYFQWPWEYLLHNKALKVSLNQYNLTENVRAVYQQTHTSNKGQFIPWVRNPPWTWNSMSYGQAEAISLSPWRKNMFILLLQSKLGCHSIKLVGSMTL